MVISILSSDPSHFASHIKRIALRHKNAILALVSIGGKGITGNKGIKYGQFKMVFCIRKIIKVGFKRIKIEILLIIVRSKR